MMEWMFVISRLNLNSVDLHGKVIHIELPQSHLPIEIIFSKTPPVKFKFNHQVIKGISLDHKYNNEKNNI